MGRNLSSDEEYKAQLKWFTDRIGKRIYRGAVSCDCKVCKSVEVSGLIIGDEMHAHYLSDCSAEMSIEYRDEPFTV